MVVCLEEEVAGDCDFILSRAQPSLHKGFSVAHLLSTGELTVGHCIFSN